MADFHHVEKEAEMGVTESIYDEDDMQQGIASPVDCWELVGSSPGSPLPEASSDVTALGEAIASACSSGSLLQANYFGYADSQADDVVLPVSTAMASEQNDDDGHSSERTNGLVSLASGTDTIVDCTIHNDLVFRGDRTDNSDLTAGDGGMHYDDRMHCNDTYCDYCSNIMSYNDQVQHGVDVLHRCKTDDEFTMYHNESTEHDDRWHIDDETHSEGLMHIEDDGVHCINQSWQPCEIVESLAVANVHHDVCAYGLLAGLESPSYSPMSLHGTEDRNTSVQQALAESSSSTILPEETGNQVEGHVMQARGAVELQHGTVTTHNNRQPKGFVYVSWIWTQLIRWQTQLGHANSIWSVALAAAVMGIIVLGRGWQRLQAQNQSLRSQLWAKEKRITQLMFQLMQTKDALTKIRRVPVICAKPSLQIPQDNF